jgi:hypothetical protein
MAPTSNMLEFGRAYRVIKFASATMRGALVRIYSSYHSALESHARERVDLADAATGSEGPLITEVQPHVVADPGVRGFSGMDKCASLSSIRSCVSW